MALYLIRGSYTAESVRGVQSAGAASRVQATEDAIKSVGGSVICGPAWSTDNLEAVVVVDLPNVAAVASSLVTVLGSGAGGLKMERLLTAGELDEGIGLSAQFRAPGQ